MAYKFDILRQKISEGLVDWASIDVRALLFESATPVAPSAALTTVAAVLAAASELSATGYARQTLTGKTADAGAGKYVWNADQVEFAITETGKNIGGLLVYAFDTDDATSWPMTLHPEVTGITVGTDVVWNPVNGVIEVT